MAAISDSWTTRSLSAGPTGTGVRASLLLRIALLLGALLAMLGIALFVAVDHWITREIEAVERQRVEHQASELRERLEAEVRQLRGLASLAASDSDLVHSTQYHVRLLGEAKAARQDVDRIAATLDFPSAAILSVSGQVLAANSQSALADTGFQPSRPPAKPDESSSSAIWHKGGLWVVGTAPIQNEGQVVALLRVARLATVTLPASDSARVQLAPVASDGSHTSITVSDALGNPVHLNVASDDRSAAVIARATRTLATIFLLGGAIAGAVMLLLLRREMKPLGELTEAAAAVGRGDFRQRVRNRGAGEIRALTSAFNAMAEDLGRLRGMEQTLREQEKITAVGRLATRLAHDINNPITVIKNAALLLLKRPVNDKETIADLELIVRHSDRCATILQNLLRFGRPLRLRSERIEVAAFCEGVIQRARIRQPAGNWLLIPGSSPCDLIADPAQLEQMLENLLNNAHEAAPDGPVELTWGQDGQRVYLEVRDKGPGFSDESRERMFELFYTTKERGTGLGLANVHAIARAHRCHVKSFNDGGAVVRIIFPAPAADPPA